MLKNTDIQLFMLSIRTEGKSCIGTVIQVGQKNVTTSPGRKKEDEGIKIDDDDHDVK